MFLLIYLNFKAFLEWKQLALLTPCSTRRWLLQGLFAFSLDVSPTANRGGRRKDIPLFWRSHIWLFGPWEIGPVSMCPKTSKCQHAQAHTRTHADSLFLSHTYTHRAEGICGKWPFLLPFLLLSAQSPISCQASFILITAFVVPKSATFSWASDRVVLAICRAPSCSLHGSGWLRCATSVGSLYMRKSCFVTLKWRIQRHTVVACWSLHAGDTLWGRMETPLLTKYRLREKRNSLICIWRWQDKSKILSFVLVTFKEKKNEDKGRSTQ